MIRSKLRCARDHFFKKTFPRLDFLKVVLVTKIANSEKMKVKKFRPPYDLCISSPSLFSQIFLKIAPSIQFFGIFSPSIKEEGVGNHVFDCFCVFLLEHFDVI